MLIQNLAGSDLLLDYVYVLYKNKEPFAVKRLKVSF